LQHGPIDLIIGVDSSRVLAREQALAAAQGCFETILERLVAELPRLRAPLTPSNPYPAGPVARRMYRAARPLCAEYFLTPMIAVAGAVADEVLHAMVSAAPLRRAYVNNGGDIALHLAAGASYRVAMARPSRQTEGQTNDLGRIRLGAASGIRGIATSGQGGRSHSLGIADSVTVLAASAAQADTAATLIANAVDVPDHPGIERTAANRLSPDSDLGARPVVTFTPPLAQTEITAALQAGTACARALRQAGHIKAAALFLQGAHCLIGDLPLMALSENSHPNLEKTHA